MATEYLAKLVVIIQLKTLPRMPSIDIRKIRYIVHAHCCTPVKNAPNKKRGRSYIKGAVLSLTNLTPSCVVFKLTYIKVYTRMM